jgi:hypothetical protein
MKHIRLYNESAAELWHKISYENLSSHMKGQLFEDFTTKELQVVLDAASTLTWSKVDEYKYRGLREAVPQAFMNFMWLPMSSLPMLRNHRYEKGEHIWTHTLYPRTKSNLLRLQFDHRSSTPSKMLVFKTNDDYFYVAVNTQGNHYQDTHKDEGFYYCDGITALVDLIKNLGLKNP